MNKQERNRLYKLMLKLYKLKILTKPFTYGFCVLLRYGCSDILFDYTDFFTEEEMNLLDNKYSLKALEELMEYKPKEIFYDCAGDITGDSTQFWFPTSNTATRIKILEECIEKTK